MSYARASRSKSLSWNPFPRPILPDSAAFTPHGRRLLVTLGAIEEDPLRVSAEEWLEGHQGPMTEAVREVRRALGPPWPDEYLQAAEEMLGSWKGSA